MENSIPKPIQDPPPEFSLPSPKWKTSDAWIGLAILVFLILGFTFAIAQFNLIEKIGMAWLIAIPEFFMLVPVAIIFVLRKVSWKELGFSKFKQQDFALGCGFLLIVYLFSVINNAVMMMLGVVTQAEVFFEVLNEIDSLVLFSISSTILAPFCEEVFFRGFLFKGFRQKYGWKVALVLSSIIFSVFHGQLATIIPTFLLGGLFAYLYQRTQSIFPGMIFHFMINSMGTCGLLFAHQYGMI